MKKVPSADNFDSADNFVTVLTSLTVLTFEKVPSADNCTLCHRHKLLLEQQSVPVALCTSGTNYLVPVVQDAWYKHAQSLLHKKNRHMYIITNNNIASRCITYTSLLSEVASSGKAIITSLLGHPR